MPVKSKLLRGLVAVIFGPLIGFGVSTAPASFPTVVPGSVMIATWVLAGIGATAYLYTHETVITAVRDGVYGVAASAWILMFFSNVGGGDFFRVVGVSIGYALPIAIVGYGIDRVWGHSGMDTPTVVTRIAAAYPDNRFTEWFQWWKALLVTTTMILLTVWIVSDGISTTPPLRRLGWFLALVAILIIYTLIATAAWRLLQKLVTIIKP